MSIEQNETRNEFLLSEAVAAVEERIRVTRPAGYELTMHLAWMRGGCRAASGLLRRSETVARAWGEGGDRKAGALVEVFALAMISRWYRELDGRRSYPEDERRVAREISVANVLRFCDSYKRTAVRRAVDDFMRLDLQYNHDADRRVDGGAGGDVSEEENLLGLRALWACGAQVDLDYLEIVAFPLRHRLDRVASRIPAWTEDPADLEALGTAVSMGAEEVLKGLDELQETNLLFLSYVPKPVHRIENSV